MSEAQPILTMSDVAYLAGTGRLLDRVNLSFAALQMNKDNAGYLPFKRSVTRHSTLNANNRPNLVENILPTRPRATLVLRKDADHSINRLRLRKL